MIDRFPNLPRSGDSSAETPHADGDSLLDSDLESILRKDRFLAFIDGENMSQVAERLREEKPDEFDIAEQMAEAIRVSLDDYEDPEEGWRPRKRSERLLAIFDVIANLATPEDIERFLNSGAVARLTDEWGDDKLNALLQRYGSLGDSYHREKNPGDSKKLKLLTRYVLGRTVDEGEERVAQYVLGRTVNEGEGGAVQVAEETRRGTETIQDNIAHQKAEREREGVFNEQLDGFVAAIFSDPNKCFGEIVSKDFEIDVPDADRYSENVKSRCADAYLKATAIEGSYPQLHDRAALALSEVLHKKLAEHSKEERGGEMWWQNYPYIRHNLAVIVPDIESYEELVRQYPGLEENNEIYEDWKKSFIDLRLKESALQEVDPSVLGLLREADVSCLDIEVEQMYVKYTSRADLYSDLEKYFIGPIDSENSVNIWDCRNSSSILQEDIIEPLNRFVEEGSWQPGEHRRFIPRSAEYPDAPYEYRETSFEDSAITIDVTKQEDGTFVYAFGIRGDVISRFAAFVGKPVGLLKPTTQAYVRIGIATRNNKATAEQLENQYQAIKDERHPDITSELGTKTYRYWDLPYSGTPNHTTAHLLQDLAGLDSQLYMKRFGPHNDELPIEADLSNLPEAQRMLCTVIDAKSGELKRLDEIVPHADMRVKNIRPDQARKLKALEYLLSITQTDRN